MPPRASETSSQGLKSPPRPSKMPQDTSKTPPRRFQDRPRANKRLQDSSKTPPGAPNTSPRGFHTPPSRFFKEFPTSFRQPDHKNQAPATARATFFQNSVTRKAMFLILRILTMITDFDPIWVRIWYQTSAKSNHHRCRTLPGPAPPWPVS